MLRFLVVDVECDFRMLLAAQLRRAFTCEVTMASSAPEAVELIQDRSFDLIITEVKMPGIGGGGLALYLMDHHIDVPVLFFTSLDISQRRLTQIGIEVPVYTKCELPQLLACVRYLFDDSRGDSQSANYLDRNPR